MRIASEDSEMVISATTILDKLSRTLLITGVPAGRKVRGFAKYLEESGRDSRLLIPVPDGGVTELPVVDVDGEPTGQVWTLGPDSEHAETMAFADLTEGIASRRQHHGPLKGYACKVAQPGAEQLVSEVLEAREIAELGLPVCYTQDDVAVDDRVLDPAGYVVVALSRRSPNPLLKVVPEALHYRAWNNERVQRMVDGIPEFDLLAAVYNRTATDEVTAVEATFNVVCTAQTDSDHPFAETLEQIRSIVDASRDVPAATRALARSLRGTPTGAELNRKLTALMNAVKAAYPLMENLRAWDSTAVQANYADYLVHTPPRTIPAN